MTTRVLILFLMVFPNINVPAQYGYIKLENDSILRGYLRSFRTVTDAQEGFEVWRTKTDKNPLKILKRHIAEYGIGNDTIEVLHDFTPFDDDDLYIDVVDAHYVLRGKISLLKTRNYRAKAFTPGAPHSANGQVFLVPVPHHLNEPSTIYLLKDKTGILRAVKWGDGLRKSLLPFFSETFLDRYEEKFGRIKYNNFPKFVKFVNAK